MSKSFIVKEEKLQNLFDLIACAKFDSLTFGQVASITTDFNKSIIEHKEETKNK